MMNQIVDFQPGVGADTMMFEMGSLKLYEILLGMVFISVILSWNPYTLPL